MSFTPGPWRVAAHDDCEVYSAAGDVYVASSASPKNALLIAACPQLFDLVCALACHACTCEQRAERCPSCRANDLLIYVRKALGAIQGECTEPEIPETFS